jgi:hypothetical protein
MLPLLLVLLMRIHWMTMDTLFQDLVIQVIDYMEHPLMRLMMNLCCIYPSGRDLLQTIPLTLHNDSANDNKPNIYNISFTAKA